MKTKILSIAAALLMSGAAVLAQNPQGRGPQGGHQQGGQQPQRPQPEQMAEMTAKHIAVELALDDATTEKFVALYKEYKMKMMEVTKPQKPQPKSDEQKAGQKTERPQLTEEAADAKIKADFEKSRKLIDVREEYYAKFREFMTAKQMMRVYSEERNDAGHMRSEFDRRQPGGPQGFQGQQGGFHGQHDGFQGGRPDAESFGGQRYNRSNEE